MAADRESASSEPNSLAVVLAAIGELEAEALVSKRGSRAPHAADVIKRLEQEGVTLNHAEVVETIKVAVSELGLATGVFSVNENGHPDARSLHVTMAGVRWLRNEIRRDPPPADAPSALPPQPLR